MPRKSSAIAFNLADEKVSLQCTTKPFPSQHVILSMVLLLQGYGAVEFSDFSNLCDTQILNALHANTYKAMILEFYGHRYGNCFSSLHPCCL